MTNEKKISDLEKKLSISFRNRDLLENAFIHRSFLNENKAAGFSSNERLEFLGDAVLELAVTNFLYDKFPEKNEGELTALRSALVKGKTLSDIAKRLNFDDYLLLSEGERRGSEAARSLILANSMEAVIGAIYIDLGFDEAEKFIKDNIVSTNLENILNEELYIDPKSKYQELIQELYKETPRYETISEEGPDHDKKFICGVRVGSEIKAKGEGRSKNQAEQNAAKNALNELKS